MLKPTAAPSDIVSDIRRKTSVANLNNLTRTSAYLQFYLNHPEVEWALLAHLISRNGGWNMTDLRGDWLPRLLKTDEIKSFYAFLERCNWLIFHDAYAQLLLYERMKQTGDDLTSLLPSLGVSLFMVPIWRDFLTHQDSHILTWALIINEQHYIEQRVVKHPFYQSNILRTFEFNAQSVLSLNQVLLPYLHSTGDPYLKLVGITVHDFPSVEHRIQVGKTLYHLLFGDQERFSKILMWAKAVPHTGSRANYWPHVFSTVKQTPESYTKTYEERLKGAFLLPGKPKIYSPTLSAAWKNTEHPPADGVDWYRDRKWIEYLNPGELLPTITEEDYVDALHRVEIGLKLFGKVT